MSGQHSLGQDRSVYMRPCQCQVSLAKVRLGQGQLRLGQVRSSHVWSGQLKVRSD